MGNSVCIANMDVYRLDDCEHLAMMFNQGFICSKCGPIPTAKNKTINKTQYQVCPDCSHVVHKWERPLNERSGRCGNCAKGSFTLALHKGRLLRCCKECAEVKNTDTGEIIRKGAKEHAYT